MNNGILDIFFKNNPNTKNKIWILILQNASILFLGSVFILFIRDFLPEKIIETEATYLSTAGLLIFLLLIVIAIYFTNTLEIKIDGLSILKIAGATFLMAASGEFLYQSFLITLINADFMIGDLKTMGRAIFTIGYFSMLTGISNIYRIRAKSYVVPTVLWVTSMILFNIMIQFFPLLFQS